MLAWSSIVTICALWRARRKSHVTALDVRDALLGSYRVQARAFLRRGMRYSDPNGDSAALERRVVERAKTFFKGLDSSYEQPTLLDLREVQRRMHSFAHPRWAARLAGLAQEKFVDDLFSRAWRDDRVWRSNAHRPPPPPPPPPAPALSVAAIVQPPPTTVVVEPEWIGLPEDPAEVFDSGKTMRMKSGLLQARMRAQAPVAPRPPGR